MTGDAAGRIPDRESLRVEFKSDRPAGLPDHELVDAAMALANTAGGDLWLGVEDDGSVTGVLDRHADADGVVALIANRTTPLLETSAELIPIGKERVLRIRVPQARPLVCTTRGTYQRRRLKEDGTPECVAIQPHEITTR